MDKFLFHLLQRTIRNIVFLTRLVALFFVQKRLRSLILTLLITVGGIIGANATHLRAGEITIRRQSCNSLTFDITITVYTNTGSQIRFGDGVLDFGDGSTPLITPTIENTLRPDLGPDIGTVSYTVSHTYGGPGAYTISYLEPNRNAGILNMFNSVETRFYIESKISIDPFLGCDNSPRLLVPPIDKACTSAAWYHNPGAYDPDGDSLSYELTIPKRDKGIEVNNYRDPNAKEFYDRIGLNYSTANEAGTGPPTFTINPVTGTIIWDAPGAPGEYNIAFIIKEWRKVSGIWINNGYVIRDMQIIVEDCKNNRPELKVPPDVCVDAGTKVTASIFGSDPDGDSVKIEVFSQILNNNISPPFQSPATYTPFPVKYQPTSGGRLAVLNFNWQTICNHVKEQPYQVVFKITDKSSKGPPLVQFKTWNIRVVGPAPKWSAATLVPAKRSVNLSWNTYACPNAETMQVWRRVDSYPYTPPQCVTGIPDYLGYSLIATVPIAQTTYTDSNNGKGLSVGASYCYRLVATYPLPNGGESYVSKDTCLAPIKADAPVITNVTIDQTSTTTGQITVRWRPPFDVDQVQFPPPYTYRVYRAEGFSGSLKLAAASTASLTDTTFTDTNLNTEQTVYNYRVYAWDKNHTSSDTTVSLGKSATASSVRLEAKPDFKRIQLVWAASVPWTNQSPKYPRHLIYRGPNGATESQMVLIDSVNITNGVFSYIDSGQWNKTPLDNNTVYCYRVKTKGTYGNKRIKEPLYNFSEITCAQPNDKVPPCKQTLAITATPCDKLVLTLPCDPKTFSNTLTWKRPTDPACRADILTYNVYMAPQVGSDFLIYKTGIRDTFFIDSNIPSFARCYKITALDRAGNESELSDQFCFDNCPSYALPNVFTPNSSDECNQTFHAYKEADTEAPKCGSQDVLTIRQLCPRFVESVVFTVYNRWGKDIYSYDSGGDRDIYINWDGRDNNGADVPAGTYYYIAKVTFNVVDPAQKTRDIKGWVQIVR